MNQPLPVCVYRNHHEHRISCGLLEEILPSHEVEVCQVSSQQCLACSRWYPPTPDELNPVVASRLYEISTRVLRGEIDANLGLDRAAQLQAFALDSIPHDYDWVPVEELTQSQQNTTIEDIGQLVPQPSERVGPKVTNWSVAVTTAPRKQSTLNHCLDSLSEAGWTDVRLMIDGHVDIDDRWSHLPMTRRLPQLGAWPSYFLALGELLMRAPDADVYMIVQDDVVVFRHSGLRAYLESVLWPPPGAGIMSLFCSRAYANQQAGWHALDQQLGWGGQALIFSKEALISFLSDRYVLEHRFGADGLANIDGLVGAWAQYTRTPIYVSTPSLAEHIGHVSSIYRQSKAFINRSAASFAGRPIVE